MYLDKLILSTITIVNIIIAEYFLIRIRNTLHIFTMPVEKSITTKKRNIETTVTLGNREQELTSLEGKR